MTQAQTAAPQGYVLGATEGEHLIHFRDAGNIFIKAGPATGSDNFALGTQQLPAGGGIPVHRHRFDKGATIFIPKNVWHGFANPIHELLLLWIMMPAGLDGFFRDTCTPPGMPAKQLTREQVNEIGRKYATEYR